MEVCCVTGVRRVGLTGCHPASEAAQPVWRGCCSAGFLGHPAKKKTRRGLGVGGCLPLTAFTQEGRATASMLRVAECVHARTWMWFQENTPAEISPRSSERAPHRRRAQLGAAEAEGHYGSRTDHRTHPQERPSSPQFRRRTGGFLYQTTCRRRGTRRHPAVEAEDSRGAKGWI